MPLLPAQLSEQWCFFRVWQVLDKVHEIAGVALGKGHKLWLRIVLEV